MNLLLVTVVLIFLLFMIIGFLRGLVKSVCKMLLMVVSLLAAYIVTPIVTSAIIKNTVIDDKIYDQITARLEQYVSDKVRKEAEQMVGDSVDDKTVEALTSTYMTADFSEKEQLLILQEIPFPQFVREELIKHNDKKEKQEIGSNGFFDYIATYLARMILRAIIFFVLLLCLIVILTIITKMLSIATHLPIVNGLNRIGGVVFGAGEALLVVWIMFVVIAMLANTSIGMDFYKQVEDNSFLTKLYEANILMSMVTIFGTKK